MKTIVVLVVIGSLLSLGAAQPFWPASARPGLGVYVVEGLGGLAGVGAGAACGAAVAFGVWELYAAVVPHAGLDALGAAFVSLLVCGAALPACAGYGVSKVGENADEDGSTAGAYIGAYAALPVAIGIGVLGGVTHNSAATIAAVTAATLTIPAGAVIGYSWNSGRGADEPTFFGHRLGLPAVAFDRVERGGHVAEYGVRVQLANVKF